MVLRARSAWLLLHLCLALRHNKPVGSTVIFKALIVAVCLDAGMGAG